MNRRSFLQLFGLGGTLVVTGCTALATDAAGASGGAGGNAGGGSAAAGGADGGAASGDTSAASDVWTVPPIALVVGSGATFDLATTLPAAVPRGGVFDVAPSGAPLPNGMTLSKAGVLAVGTAAIGDVTGVVFTYEH